MSGSDRRDASRAPRGLHPFRTWVLAPAPWKYFLVLLLGFGLTSSIVVVELMQLQRGQEAAAFERAAAIGSSISRTIDSYSVPTLAGETFVASGVAEEGAGGPVADDHIEQGFEAFTLPLKRELGDALLDYQIAPVGVVTYSAYPEDNAAAIGHNILRDDDRRAGALDSIENRVAVVAGPYELLQGGTGLIVRQPIFLDGLTDFESRYREFTNDTSDAPWLARVPDDFWGFSTAVINFDALVDEAGLSGLNTSDYAIRPIDSDGRIETPIWGEGELGSRTARTVIELPDGSYWLVSADPQRIPAVLVWPVALLGAILSILGTWLYGRYYRARMVDRLGFDYSSLVWGMNKPEDVAQVTADFLHRTYPQMSGVIAVNEPVGFRVRFGDYHSEAADRKSHKASTVTRLMARGDRSLAIVELEVPPRYAHADVEGILDVVDRPLTSSLVSIAHQEYLEIESSTDHLTSLRNRRLLQPTYEDLTSYALRDGHSISMAVLDIDHFKDLNDGRGHQFGDLVLQKLAAALNDAMRDMDMVFRFGGDEFVILSVTAHASDASMVFERVRGAANSSLRDAAPEFPQCTCSVGIATCPSGPFPPMTEMLSAADSALYRAKNQGRNQAVFEVVTDGDRGPHRRSN